MRTTPLIPVICIALAVNIGCGIPASPAARDQRAAQPAAPSVPKRLVVAIKSNPPTLSRAVIGFSGGTFPGSGQLEMLVNGALTVLDGRGERRPQLGEAVPSLENGLWTLLPDGRMETTWKIRPEARWHDGTPVTADDLLFTAQVVQDKDLPMFRKPAFDFIESVEVADSRALMVKWKRPYIHADSMFSHELALPLPKHILDRPFAEDKSTFPQLPYWSQEFVGTGPFKLREWTEGSHLVLQANSEYVLGRPKIDEIEVKFIPDNNTLIANILAGTVDATMGRGVSLEQGLQLRDRWPQGRLDLEFNNLISLFPQFVNPNPPVLGDVQFRRALLHAIDRQALADTLLYGLVPIGHTLVSPQDALYRDADESSAKYEYDPARTSRIIESLDYTKGADGYFRDSSGQRLEVEIQAVTTTEMNESLMMAVGDYWQRVGVGVATVAIPVQQQQNREYRMGRRGFDLAGGAAGADGWTRWVSSQAPLPENNYLGNNKPRYMSREFDALIDRYLVTIPLPERVGVLRQIFRHASEQLIVMGLVWDAEATLISNRIEHAAGGVATGAFLTWNVHEWELR